MYTVGSAGIVDPSDSGKVVCAGPVAQLGIGVGGLEPPVAGTEGAIAARVTLPQTTATIRYPVPAEEPALSSALGFLGLVLRYRSGTGRVVATLLEVPVPYDELGDSGTVTERALLQFDSASASAGPSPAFSTAIVRLPRGSGLYGCLLEFGPNVYYVDLTLTGSAIVAGQPPAVVAIEITGFQPPGSGGGYGDGGGGSGGYDGGGDDDGDPGHDPD